MISGSKGQKVVRACTIRLLTLGPAKHEEVAIYIVNQRIPNVLELRELFCSGAIRRCLRRGKIPFYLRIIIYVRKNMITSTANEQIKNLIQLQNKAKARRQQGLFVTEGIRMCREVPADCLMKTYISESFYQKEENRRYLETLPKEKREVVADHVLEKAADTQTPQGILSVVKQKEYKAEQVLAGDAPLLLLLEDIQDPGNLGTIFRTAEGAGVTGILMNSGTVDIYNPKTIRSTMGSLYRMPFLKVENFDEVLKELKTRNIRTYAAHLKGTLEYTDADYTGGSAFMIGNEGNGLSKELADQADAYIKISMSGQLESLNAAVAAAILMFEARRQRTI